MDIPNRETGAKLRRARGLEPVEGPTPGSELKWLDAGEPNRYHGWTIISSVPLDSVLIEPSLEVLSSLQEDFATGEWSIHPLSSLHMTVFRGMTQYTILEDGNPEWVRKHDDPMGVWKEAVDRIAEADLPKLSAPLEVEVVRFTNLRHAGHVNVQFTTAKQAEEVSALRHGIAEAVDWFPDDIDDYGFHISYSYRLITPPSVGDKVLDEMRDRYTETLKSAGPITLEPPVVSVFESMVSFPGVVRLG